MKKERLSERLSKERHSLKLIWYECHAELLSSVTQLVLMSHFPEISYVTNKWPPCPVGLSSAYTETPSTSAGTQMLRRLKSIRHVCASRQHVVDARTRSRALHLKSTRAISRVAVRFDEFLWKEKHSQLCSSRPVELNGPVWFEKFVLMNAEKSHVNDGNYVNHRHN